MKNKLTLKEVKERLDNCIDLYVDFFCKKHDMDFGGWVGNIKGGVCEVADMYLSFEDIRLDLEKDVYERGIYDWYWNNIEAGEKRCNYESFIMNLPQTKYNQNDKI